MNYQARIAAVYKANSSLLFVHWDGLGALFHFFQKSNCIFMLKFFRYLHPVLTKKLCSLIFLFFLSILTVMQAPLPTLGEID